MFRLRFTQQFQTVNQIKWFISYYLAINTFRFNAEEIDLLMNKYKV